MKKIILIPALALALVAAAASLFTSGGSRAQAACPKAGNVTFNISPATVRPGELVTFEWRVPRGMSKMTMSAQYGGSLDYDLAERGRYAAWALDFPDEKIEVEETEGGYVWRQRLRMMAPAHDDNLYTVTAHCDHGGEPVRATAVMKGSY